MKGHNQKFFGMLFSFAVDTADTIMEFPVGGITPPENKSLSIICKAHFMIRFVRHDTVKPLGICQRNLAFLARKFRPAVNKNLQTGPLLYSFFN